MVKKLQRLFKHLIIIQIYSHCQQHLVDTLSPVTIGIRFRMYKSIQHRIENISQKPLNQLRILILPAVWISCNWICIAHQLRSIHKNKALKPRAKRIVWAIDFLCSLGISPDYFHGFVSVLSIPRNTPHQGIIVSSIEIFFTRIFGITVFSCSSNILERSLHLIISMRLSVCFQDGKRSNRRFHLLLYQMTNTF